MAAWRDIAALRDPDRFEAWLRRLLVRACYREARKERARRLVEVHVPVFDRSVPDASARRRRPRRARAGLPQPDAGPARTASSSTTTSASRSAETADALGIPVGTVKSRLHRTTQALRARLDADARAADALIGERPA